MPPAKLEEDRLIALLAGLFRRYGYEGTSLAMIAEATGLAKASLYHRFPAGKEEMATAVLSTVRDMVRQGLLAPAWAPGDPGARLKAIGENLQAFYQQGTLPCILDSMSITVEAHPQLQRGVREILDVFLEGLQRLAMDFGHAPPEARRRAEDALTAVQGSLVVSRLEGHGAVFMRTLQALPMTLAR